MENTLRLQWAELVGTLGQNALDILGGAPVTITEKRFADPKVVAIMLMSRTLSNFKGAVTLLEHGLVVEARILVRCCLENAFWIAELVTDGDKFVKKMFEDEMWSVKTRGELMLSKKLKLDDDVEKRLRHRLREINKKRPKAVFLTPKDVALSGLLHEGYIIYSQLSADAAHPTATSLNRHVGRCEENGEQLIDVVPAPTEKESLWTWDLACNAMLGACVGVNQILGGTPAGQQLGAIADRYHALTTRRKALQSAVKE